ncbi:MAG TPA: TraX family protein [Candidatus Levybacteria bacterium]|nr:TraX family protein [Candidatus Levybacteria bacterium]
MSVFHIKLIAIILMVVDHVGIFFFPELLIFRIIGRLSFPLFGWLIANGAYHTKNINAYTFRLFVFALISQIPYWLAFHSITSEIGFNIFFTLTLGVLAIQLIQRTNQKLVWIGIGLVGAIIGEILAVDYGAAGVLSILMFYFFFHNPLKMFLSQLLIFISFYTVPILEQGMSNDIVALFQPVAAFVVIVIAFYNGREGPKAKYLFYLFYPLHLLILYLIAGI